eukprot:INCI12118.2.p1 GENE.INCI12118.2~~INCI12118.2.p1  ORF type:complete len:473 (-),score=105.84 INCI12118.2:409-1827(-)
MGTGASVQYDSVEDALADGRTKEEIDSYLLSSAAAAASERTSSGNNPNNNGNGKDEDKDKDSAGVSVAVTDCRPSDPWLLIHPNAAHISSSSGGGGGGGGTEDPVDLQLLAAGAHTEKMFKVQGDLLAQAECDGSPPKDYVSRQVAALVDKHIEEQQTLSLQQQPQELCTGRCGGCTALWVNNVDGLEEFHLSTAMRDHLLFLDLTDNDDLECVTFRAVEVKNGAVDNEASAGDDAAFGSAPQKTSAVAPVSRLRELNMSGLSSVALPHGCEQWACVGVLLSLDLSFVDGLDLASIPWAELPLLLRLNLENCDLSTLVVSPPRIQRSSTQPPEDADDDADTDTDNKDVASKKRVQVTPRVEKLGSLDGDESKSGSAPKLGLTGGNGPSHTSNSTFSLPSLRWLNIADNKFAEIDALAPLQSMRHLQELDARGNPVCSTETASAAQRNMCASLPVLGIPLLRLPCLCSYYWCL